MQQELTYLKCLSHPRDILSSVCKAVNCKNPNRLVCNKCMKDHRECEASIVSLEQFLIELDNIRYAGGISSEHKEYTAELKNLQINLRAHCKEIRDAVDAAEREIEEILDKLLRKYEGSSNINPSNPNFIYRSYQSAESLGSAISNEVQKLLDGRKRREVTTRGVRTGKNKILEIQEQLAKEWIGVNAVLKSALENTKGKLEQVLLGNERGTVRGMGRRAVEPATNARNCPCCLGPYSKYNPVMVGKTCPHMVCQNCSNKILSGNKRCVVCGLVQDTYQCSKEQTCKAILQQQGSPTSG